MSEPPGTLFVVATPIGHREDISARALGILQAVDLIAAEDTRHSALLLTHFGIRTPMVSLHEHNERASGAALIRKLELGTSIALISDAGTPGISDPGTILVNEVLQKGIRVVPVPGPSALTALMSVSGFGDRPFLFQGFLPAKSVARLRALAALKSLQATLVFYESPHRIYDSMADMKEVLGETRVVVIGRELTKQFETVHRTTLAEALPWLEQDPNHQRGEFVLAVEGASTEATADVAIHDAFLLALMEKLSISDSVRIAMLATGLGRKVLYARALELSGKTSRENC